MYDVGNRESFDALDSWLEEIKTDIGSSADFEGVSFAVCANKVETLHCTCTCIQVSITFVIIGCWRRNRQL